MTENPKLLEPLSTVVSFVVRLLIGSLVIGFVLSLFNTGVHVGWGGASVCVTDDSTGGSSTGTDRLFLPRAGAGVDLIPRYCAGHPSSYQKLLDVLSALPSFILLISSLLLLNRLLRGAARDGVYTVQTASRLRLLGWWLLLGSLVVEFTKANAQAALLATLAKEAAFSAGAWLGTWESPYMAVFTALGLLTFARIVRAGVIMREDLEGTV
ncbi:hypothetical protein ABZ612_27225 [Streptomyces avermitilis]|uniref:hypothetical protein n=1 Tax=Streptomyces avermitilis TaxID=33903 RepID=UPI0033FA6446